MIQLLFTSWPCGSAITVSNNYKPGFIPADEILATDNITAKSMMQCVSRYQKYQNSSSFYLFEKERETCVVGSVKDRKKVKKNNGGPGMVKVMANLDLLIDGNSYTNEKSFITPMPINH